MLCTYKNFDISFPKADLKNPPVCYFCVIFVNQNTESFIDMPWSLKMTSFAALILLILLVYFGIRYFESVKALGLKPLWAYRFLLFIPAVLFLAYPLAGQMQHLLTGSFSRTGFPDFMIYLFWYGLVCMGVMLNLLLLHDILLTFMVRATKTDHQKRKIWFARVFLIIAGVTVGYTAVKMTLDTHRIVTDEITYTLPEGTGLHEPLTIVHITDLHADEYTGARKMERYIRKVNDANPDLVIFTGDLISSGRDHIEAGADAMAGIEATYGTWFVMGDHDYWVSTEEIAEALESRGINVLQNENAVIRHNNMVLRITGVTELYSYQVDDLVLDSLLNDSAGEDLHLLASHQSTDRLIERAVGAGVHQLLSGHTHGGQIRVRLFTYPVTAARAETEYVKGTWHMGNMLLNVNSGLGFTLTPVRYNAPAQVSVIRVR